MNKNTYKEQINKLKNEIYQNDLKHIYEKNYKYVKSFVKSKVSKLLLPETFNEMNSEEFYINLRTNQYLAENEMSYANFFNFCQFDFEKSLCNIEQYMKKPSIFVTFHFADSTDNKILEFNCLYDMFLLHNKCYLFGLEKEICFEIPENIYKLLNYIKNKTIEISRTQFYSLINKDSYCDSLIKQGIIY